MMEIANYKIHPLAQKVPEMTPNEYRQLKESLQQTAQTAPIITYQGEVIDGRHRLKACLELGFIPWIKEYEGDKPVAQYILSTNIRRNLTKVQRQQMLADFAAEIIPQVEAEMKERKPWHKKMSGGDSPPTNSSHPGRRAFMEATGASVEEAKMIKSIHDRAPELLGEVAKNGGLTPTEKEARRRCASKPKEPEKEKGETPVERQLRMIMERKGQKLGLSMQEVDPDFKGTRIEFIDKYGHVQLQTKVQMEIDRDRNAFSAWVGAIRSLRVPLRDYLKVEKFKPENFQAWIKKAPSQEKRISEIKELVAMIIQSKESIDWLIPLLEAPVHGGNGHQ